MCWMTIRRETDALAKGILEVSEHESNNGQSWGYAYAEDDELHTTHGMGEIDLNGRKIPSIDNALVHTRYATTGEIDKRNAHPFDVVDPSTNEQVGALAHNGTWNQAPHHPERSDTFMMVKYLESLLLDLEFEEALHEFSSEVGETFILLKPDGTIYAYSGRYDITREGSIIASSGYEQIPSETIVKVESDGSIDKQFVLDGASTKDRLDNPLYEQKVKDRIAELEDVGTGELMRRRRNGDQVDQDAAKILMNSRYSMM